MKCAKSLILTIMFVISLSFVQKTALATDANSNKKLRVIATTDGEVERNRSVVCMTGGRL